MIKYLEMERLSWIIQVSSKRSHEYLYKGKAEGDLTHTEEKVMKRQSREKSEDVDLEDRSDAAMSQKMPEPPKAKSQGMEPRA